MLENVKFFLRDLDEKVVAAWKEEFSDLPNFDIDCEDIFNVHADVIVSPANSFGIMDGGIDAAYTRFFGNQLQQRLQAQIKEGYLGELPVGSAILLPTNNEFIRYLLSCPTMRVPQVIRGTLNAYLAFRAGLVELAKYNTINSDYKLNSVLCPGLGTLTGMLSPRACAHQMRVAYDSLNPTKLEYNKILHDHYMMFAWK